MTTATDYDVVVVGAGVAGALIAARLAQAGVRTLVLEAGPRRSNRLELVGSYSTASAKIPSAPYGGTLADERAPYPRVTDGLDDGHYLQKGPDPFKSTYERLVGGSTWHWLGNTPRFVLNDFRLRDAYGVGVNWPKTVRYETLEKWYVEAENELGVSGDHDEWNGLFGTSRTSAFPLPRIWPAFGDDVVAESLHGKTFNKIKVHLRVTPQARNSTVYQGRPSCAGNSSCVPICPIQAKYDATVHIRIAENPSGKGAIPAEIRHQCIVRRLHVTDGKVKRVEYERWTEDGTSAKEQIRARVYVLATHAIETPLLLLASGIAQGSPVGNYLMDHLQGYGGAILPTPVFPFRGPPVTSGIDEFRDGAFRKRRAAFRISIGNDGWGRMEPLEELIRQKIFDEKLVGRELRDALNHRVTRMLRMSFSTEMLPDFNNRVELGPHDKFGSPRPRIHFEVSEYNKRSFEYASSLLAKFFQKLGATETKFTYPDKMYSGAGHIMGTCRMGEVENDSVVNTRCQVHGHPELFVVGAQTFPTSGTANPTLTVAALALRASKHITDQLKESDV